MCGYIYVDGYISMDTYITRSPPRARMAAFYHKFAYGPTFTMNKCNRNKINFKI